MSDAPGGAEIPCPGSHDNLRFGPFAFETSKKRLFRDSVEVHLTPKAAAVLCYLLQRPDELITKDEFLEAVWEGVFVREESLTQAISVIRNQLGDSAQSPLYIETVSGEGYRFVGEVSTGASGGAEAEPAYSGEEPGSSASSERSVPEPGPPAPVWWRVSREVLATAAVVVMAIGALAWFWPVPGPEAPPDFATVTSYPGYENYPALSPDGEQVAFMWNGGDGAQVYVKFVSGGDPLPLAKASYGDIAWGPKGERIAYMRGLPAGEDGPGLEVCTITAIGTDHRVETTTTSTVTDLDWSPDGRFLAFSDSARPGERENIFLFSRENGVKHQVTFHSGDEATFDISPSFSPDGRHLAFIRVRAGAGGAGYIYVQRLDGEGLPVGGPQRLVSPDGFLYDVDWTADGSAVVYSGGASFDNLYLTKARLDGSEPPARLAVGDRARDFSIEHNRLVFSERQDDVDLWRVGGPTAEHPGAPEHWPSSTHDDHFPNYSPDGTRVAFISGRTGAWEVWVANADGSDPHQLTHLGHATRPRWAPDSKLIAFNSGTRDRTDVYVVDPDEGPPRNLTRGFRDAIWNSIPGWSADSQWIYFQSRGPGEGRDEGPWEIWRMSREGDNPTRIEEVWGVRPLLYAGRLYVWHGNRIVSHAEDGGQGTVVVDRPIKHSSWDLWHGNLVFIELSEPGTAAINIVDLETGDLSTHASVPVEGNAWLDPEGTLAVSPDGQFILYSAKARPGGADLILVDNFR